MSAILVAISVPEFSETQFEATTLNPMRWLLLVKIEFLLAKCDGLEITATCLYLVWQNCHILHPVNYQQMELRSASLGIETLSPRQKERQEERDA